MVESSDASEGGVGVSGIAKKSRPEMLSLSISAHDPERTLAGQ
jgi:hypothetical protein